MATLLEEGDDAFLRELLALLTGESKGDLTETEPAVGVGGELPTSRVRRVGKHIPKEPTGTKRTIALLLREERQLTEQLQRLRSAQANGSSEAMERALAERLKRHKAEDERQTLRRAVAKQTHFLRGLRSVFSISERLSVSLDMCRHLHRHTRLTRNHSSRWGKYDAQSHSARMASAMDILCQETATITLSDNSTVHVIPSDSPFVHCELISDVNSRSTTYTSVYTLNTDDVAAVVRAVCVAIRDVVTICPSGHPLNVSHDVVDTDTPSDHNLLYRAMRVHHCCATTGEEILVASRIVTSYKVTDDYGVVLWDYVDDDERHPALDATNLTRETTGACLIRRERCSDGVQRVVFRSLGTKKFRFRNALAVAKHGRIGCIVQADAMVRGDELLFRRIVLDQIAAENALCASVSVVAHV